MNFRSFFREKQDRPKPDLANLGFLSPNLTTQYETDGFDLYTPRLKMTPILQPHENMRFNPDLTFKNDARLHVKKTES